MNRPASIKPDNFFLLIYRALRQRRVPLVLRIAAHTLLLVALALVIYAWVMGMQFKQAMEQQADALGNALMTQTAASATDLLVALDVTLTPELVAEGLARDFVRGVQDARKNAGLQIEDTISLKYGDAGDNEGAIQAHAAQQLNPYKLILVAPSVERMNAPAVVNHARHTLVIQGDQDTIVPLQSVLDWAAPQTLPVTVIPGAEHFFHGKLNILKNIILQNCK